MKAPLYKSDWPYSHTQYHDTSDKRCVTHHWVWDEETEASVCTVCGEVVTD